ncbi:MAG: phytanoyl-CoA dioxygenase family protein [Planctomycetes bacterium]|nr:phytanoyl-CoA dioxygenase family protein [Planctomycetota bacterium]
MEPVQRRQGDRYVVTPAEFESFQRDGYVHLRSVLSEDELLAIEAVYDRFVAGEIPVAGKDFCDMSGDYARSADDFSIVNVMLPRRYHPDWQGNVLERRAASIAAQLQGQGLALDYDQLLAKRPHKEDAVFAWHQDLAYWPRTPDTRTATIWLALDDSTIENGCMRFVPGSHREPTLRPHRPLHGDRETSHTLVAEVDEARDPVHCVEIARGDVTVHDERVLHGSGGNRSARWRRAYIVAFRALATVKYERSLGFTHSHNDAPDVLRDVARNT